MAAKGCRILGKVLSFCFKKGVQKLHIFVNIETDNNKNPEKEKTDQ